MRRFFLKLRKRLRLERDLDAELGFHRDMSDRRFGNSMRIREEAWELWTFPFIESLIRDFRLAFRVLAKSPSFTVVSLLTLSLGVGINTAVFTLYDSLTYRLLPVHAPEEMVRVVRQSGNSLQPVSVSYSEFERLRKGMEGFADVIATSPSQTVPGGLRVQFVSGDYFAVLGVGINQGRALAIDGQGVVVSRAFWTSRLRKDPAISGKRVDINGVRLAILGVAPEAFYGTDFPPQAPDYWIPLTTQSRVMPGADPSVRVLARRATGITLDRVSMELRRIDGMSWLTATNATAFQTNMGGFRGTGTIGLILMGAVGVILLIGCVNLVNLTMSRNEARKREIAVRLAIGAGRRQIVQQLCAESIVLGIVSGAFGLGLSVILCEWIRVGALTALDRISSEVLGGLQLNLAPDWRVFAYTLGLSILAGALVGIWPALGSTEADLHASTKSEGVRRGRRHLLLTAQIAACLVLLAGAGLLFRGAWRSRSANPGFGLDRILVMGIDLNAVDAAAGDRVAVLRRVLDRTRSLPDVTNVALVDRFAIPRNRVRSVPQ